MNVKLVFKVLGHILRIESVFLLLPAIVALIYGESPLPFLLTALLLLCVGQGLCRLKTGPHFFTRGGLCGRGPDLVCHLPVRGPALLAQRQLPLLCGLRI